MKLLRNPLAVGALAFLALAFVVWNLARPLITRYAARLKAAPAATAKKPTRVSPNPNATHVAPEAGTPMDLALIQTRVSEWLESPVRDPFEAYFGAIGGPTGPRAADLLALKAVWRQTGDRLAVINDHVVGEGDQVLGFRIDRIEGDGVWVHGTNGTERIQFPDPTSSGPGPGPNPAKRTTARKRAASS